VQAEVAQPIRSRQTATGKIHGSLEKPTPPVADNEVGPRFELLKIARCHQLVQGRITGELLVHRFT